MMNLVSTFTKKSTTQRVVMMIVIVSTVFAGTRKSLSYLQEELDGKAGHEFNVACTDDYNIAPSQCVTSPSAIHCDQGITVNRSDSAKLNCHDSPTQKGVRFTWSRLVDRHRSLTVTPVYIGEMFSNTRGGISTDDATRYQGLLDLGLKLDLDRLVRYVPGKFFMLVQNSHGRGLTEDFTGDAQVLSNIDSGGNIMRVSEYWWEFDLVDDQVSVRLGKQDVSTEFFFLESAEDFVQSSFGLTPATALPTYPDQSFGGVILASLADSLQLKIGVWDALAFKRGWGFSGNATMFFASELEFKYALASGDLPGTLAVGVGYLTNAEVNGRNVDASHGFLLQIEQLIWREGGPGDDVSQGLGGFFSYVPRFFGERRLDESIGNSYVGGLVYRGLIPNRDKDVFGMGVAWAELFRGGENQETVFECFYKAQFTPRVSLQPDVQYIASPSGIHRDALVVGLRLQLSR